MVQCASMVLCAMWVTAKICVCDRCGHRWIPEVANPVRCPSRDCRSVLWNRSESLEAIITAAAVGAVARQDKPGAEVARKKYMDAVGPMLREAKKKRAVEAESKPCSHGLIWHPDCSDKR
jgi:hypothetical protein